MNGNKYGRWTVISEPFTDKGRKTILVRCKCGTEKIVRVESLKSGKSRSCGCLKREQTRERLRKIGSEQLSKWARERFTRHNGAKTRLYTTWVHLKERCTNPNDKRYKYYGGRGITVCFEWRNSYEAFREWAKSAGYNEILTLDRIDNNGHYCPENCRFTTRTVQSQNRRKQSNNTSGYIGVTFDKSRDKWQAQAKRHGCPIHLGRFDTAIEAARVRDAYVAKHYESPTLNFPNEVLA